MLGIEYLRNLESAVERLQGQTPQMAEAARLIVECAVRGGRFYVHDTENVVSNEVAGRTGGLMMLRELRPWNIIDLRGSENDVVAIFMNGMDPKGERTLIDEVRKRRMKVIGVFPTSSKGHPLRSSEVIIDNGLVEEGGIVEVPGFKEKVGPVHAVLNSVIAMSICAEVIDEFIRRGLKPSVYMSLRREGSTEYNRKISAQYERQGY
jgi:uncharacterized phosphosugar-binding protein